MSLLNAYKKATNGWDAKKDKISSGYEDIPVGEYEVVMNKAEHFVSKKSGYEALTFDMQVIEGDYAGRHERVFTSLAEKDRNGKAMPEFVISRNIQTIAKIAALSDVDLDDSDFEGVETDVIEKIVEKFRGHEGASMMMNITERANKKNPDNPYRSYDFAEAENSEPTADELPTGKDTADAGDDDDSKLPF